jgi:hypothetical protein
MEKKYVEQMKGGEWRREREGQGSWREKEEGGWEK